LVYRHDSSPTTEDEFASMCYLGYDDVLPCDLFVFDVPIRVCYMGNRATNKNMTVPNEVSHVYFNPGNALINKKESVLLLNIYFGHTVFSDIIDPVVDPIYLDQGSVSGSTWAPYIFNTVDLSELQGIQKSSKILFKIKSNHLPKN
jgi:hypothetical protein